MICVHSTIQSQLYPTQASIWRIGQTQDPQTVWCMTHCCGSKHTSLILRTTKLKIRRVVAESISSLDDTVCSVSTSIFLVCVAQYIPIQLDAEQGRPFSNRSGADRSIVISSSDILMKIGNGICHVVGLMQVLHQPVDLGTESIAPWCSNDLQPWRFENNVVLLYRCVSQLAMDSRTKPLLSLRIEPLAAQLCRATRFGVLCGLG